MPNIYEILRRDQNGTSDYVKEFLTSIGVAFEVDSYGNIYYLDHENAPLLSAHMDTVRKDSDFVVGAFLTEDEDERIFSGGILGGDDKCGVYIILKALKEGKKVNFIFSRDEEIGCLGIKALLKPNYVENKTLADKIRNNCLWCLVLDRRGNSDIICTKNAYGTLDFEKALEKMSEAGNFGYKAAQGLSSDANTIREFVSTANISVGYYKPHSEEEYIVKADLQKAYDYTIYLIDNLKDKFKPTAGYYSGSGYGYGGYYNGYYGGYMGKASRALKNKANKAKGVQQRYYNYGYDDDYDWDYYGYGYGYGYGYNAKKDDGIKRCECAFCGDEGPESDMQDFIMPDGEMFKICGYCFDDMEKEVKRVRASFDNPKVT